jgi:hypothetical protein
MDEIKQTTASNYSFVFPTRSKVENLKACISSIYENAKDKESFDIIIRIDDDDLETKGLLDSGYFNDINLKYLSGDRLGYDGLYKDWVRIYPLIGKSFIYYSDDHRMRVKDFDVLLNKHLDHPCVFGLMARNGVTKLLMEKDEFFRSYAGMRGKCDTYIWQRAKRLGLYEPSFGLYERTDGKILGRLPT